MTCKIQDGLKNLLKFSTKDKKFIIMPFLLTQCKHLPKVKSLISKAALKTME